MCSVFADPTTDPYNCHTALFHTLTAALTWSPNCSVTYALTPPAPPQVLRFLRDNIVGTVLVISIIIWVPASCVFSYVDAKRRRQEEEEMAWQRRDQLIRPGQQRVLYTRRRLPERDRPPPSEYGASARM